MSRAELIIGLIPLVISLAMAAVILFAGRKNRTTDLLDKRNNPTRIKP